MNLKKLRRLTRGLPGNTSILVTTKAGKDHIGVTAEVVVDEQARKGTRRIQGKYRAFVILTSPTL